MLDKVRSFIELNNMIAPEDVVVVGVSGGADSMCLLSVLLELNVPVLVVHVNHMLRGEEAENDMKYVENFCKDKGIKCFSFSYDVEQMAKDRKLSCEEVGRMVRYEAFHKVLQENNASKIAVAHNAGDSAETVLHNLFRGTGIKGLKGIAPTRDNIIRPLLCVDRREIEEYLSEKDISYRTDATNLEDIYTRNKIRNVIIKYATENINSNAIEHIAVAGQMLGDIDDFLEQEARKSYDMCCSFDGSNVYINVQAFEGLHKVLKPIVVRQSIHTIENSLKDISAIHIQNVIDLFDKPVGKMVDLPYGLNAKKGYDDVVIGKENAEKEELFDDIQICKFGEFLLHDFDKKLIVSASSVDEWNEDNNKYGEKIYTKWLDCDILKANLVIRTRRQGDYIVTDSIGSKKKIKDLFIDLKIPKEQRDKVLLLANGSEIVWIIGHRINYNYRITDTTEVVTKLEYKGIKDTI